MKRMIGPLGLGFLVYISSDQVVRQAFVGGWITRRALLDWTAEGGCPYMDLAKRYFPANSLFTISLTIFPSTRMSAP
jgi:hypothetical protein